MAADAPRRSARARKPVTTYAEEQGEETTAPKPVSKRKRDVAKDDDASPEPRKKSKKAEATTTNSQDVKRLVTTEKRPPGERRPPQVWDVPKQLRKPKDPKAPGLAALLADTFEERYQRQVSKIKRLAPGQEETRLKAYVPELTDSYETFLQRARTQRLVVLGRSRGHEENCHAGHEDCPYHTVKIAGTTGNVYTVIISHLPTCSCPNTAFKRKNSGDALCKHILYVLHFVLKAPTRLCGQNAFLTSELEEIDAGAPTIPTESVAAVEEDLDGRRKPMEDDCPICCMAFEDDEEVTWCRAACGNNVHKGCFDQWARMKQKVTCPFCRTEWQYGDAKGKSQTASMGNIKMPTQRGRDGYSNVADQLVEQD